MTLITIDLARDGQPADNITGTITAETTDKRISGLSLIIPAPIVTTIYKGKASLDLSATSKNFAWKLTFKIPGVDAWTDYVLVPNRVAINYTELTHVDPETLIKVRNPDPSWYALLTNALQSVAPGPQGPEGKTGERGEKGERGYTGLRGETGAQGERGQTGERGPNGLQGIQGETGPTGPQGTQGQRGLTGERGLQGIQGERGLQGLQGIQGVKGDTGIGWVPVTLSTQHLDGIGIGLFRQPNGANSSVALGYPHEKFSGIIKSTNWGATEIIQEATPIPLSVTTGIVGTYQRGYRSGWWSGWAFIPKQRVDNTAGRAIYTWDDTAEREQLIYGDTGERDVSALLSDATGTAIMRRRGYNVVIDLIDVKPTTALGEHNILVLGNGYRPAQRERKLYVPKATTGAISSVFITTGGAIRIWATNTADLYRMSFSFNTTDPWPTTLPGLALTGAPVQ